MTQTTEPTAPTASPEDIDAFVGRFATDLAAVAHAATPSAPPS